MQSLESWVEHLKKLQRLVDKGVITTEEFSTKLFHDFAWYDPPQVQYAGEIWQLLEESVRREFCKKIDQVLRPDYMDPPFLWGGGRPATDEELRLQSVAQTARVKAWANEFQRFRTDI